VTLSWNNDLCPAQTSSIITHHQKNLDSQKAKAEKFEGEIFKKVYDRHIDTLTKLKKKVNAYHKFMLELYSKVT